MNNKKVISFRSFLSKFYFHEVILAGYSPIHDTCANSDLKSAQEARVQFIFPDFNFCIFKNSSNVLSNTY